MISTILDGKHKIVVTSVRNIMEETGMNEQDAYYEYINRMAKRGSRGGKNTTFHGFSHIPGLAQKAGRISRPNKKK